MSRFLLGHTSRMVVASVESENLARSSKRSVEIQELGGDAEIWNDFLGRSY